MESHSPTPGQDYSTGFSGTGVPLGSQAARPTVPSWRCVVDTPVTPIQQVEHLLAEPRTASQTLPKPDLPPEPFEFESLVGAVLALLEDPDPLIKH